MGDWARGYGSTGRLARYNKININKLKMTIGFFIFFVKVS